MERSKLITTLFFAGAFLFFIFIYSVIYAQSGGKVYDLGDYITMAGVLLSLYMFLVFAGLSATSEIKTDEDFLFAKNLSKKRIISTTAATLISVSGTFLFLLTQGYNFGTWLILAPISIYFSYLIFLWLIKKMVIRPENVQKYGSIPRICYHKLDKGLWAKRLAYIVNIVVILAFLLIFVAEMFIGAAIFDYLFVADRALVTLLIGLITIGYISFGGFKIMTYTDKIQLKLVYFAVIALGIAILWLTFFTYPEKIGVDLLIRGSLDSLPIWFLVAFILQTVVSVLFQVTTEQSTWQRFASSNMEKRDEFHDGTKKGAFVTIKIWSLCIIFGLIAVHILPIDNAANIDIGFILDSVRGSIPHIGNLILYPILFVGMLGALISTADSRLLSVMLAWRDTETLGKNIDELPERKLPIKIKYALIGFACVLLAIIPNFFQGEWINILIVILYAAYGAGVILFPLLIWINKFNVSGERAAKCGFFAILFGLLTFLYIHYTANFTGLAFPTDQIYALSAATIAGLVTTVVIVFSHLVFFKNKQKA